MYTSMKYTNSDNCQALYDRDKKCVAHPQNPNIANIMQHAVCNSRGLQIRSFWSQAQIFSQSSMSNLNLAALL